MHDWVTQIGAGGAFLLITLKLVLDYLKTLKKPHHTDPENKEMAEVGRRLLNLENRMGTAESAIHRGVGVMEGVTSQIERMEQRIWNIR